MSGRFENVPEVGVDGCQGYKNLCPESALIYSGE